MSEFATIRETIRDRAGTRPLSLGGVSVLLVASLSVLAHVTDVVGGAETETLVFVAAASVAASTLLARLVRPAVALVLALGLLALGGGWYFLTLPGVSGGLSTDVLIADALALLSGLSVLRITNAGQWAIAAAPAPVFLTWYLAVRRRYVAAIVVGGGFLGLFVLTGDASTPTALIGVVGGAGAVGFGELEGRVGEAAGTDVVAVVLAVMVVATLTVGVVPGGAGSPLSPGSGGGGTVEASLVDVADRVPIRGSIRLSPEVRFTVTSERSAYWHVASYDRYTGGAWLRTGSGGSYDAALEAPRGRTRTVAQTYRAESPVDTMPAAWKPVEVTDGAARAQVTRGGSLRPRTTLEPGDEYGVVSEVPATTAAELRGAGTDYPERIRERYLQLPDSTPDRVVERTSRITANAENAYDTARVVEFWLERNRAYSLDVTRPDGSIADAFLFEMEAGYCTYYATTMVVMLRSQGIPARFVTGYTPGQQVDDGRWVVRGLDSHAWVEVYFPGQGWVQFDPTPGGPRESAEQTRLEEARTQGEQNVDTGESEPDPTPTPANPDPTPTGGDGTTPTAGNVTANVSDPFGGPGFAGGFDDGGVPTPSREEVGLGLVVAIGVVAALRRTGLAAGAWREVWLRRSPGGSPVERVDGAFERLEYLLAGQYRERRSGETARQYLAAVATDSRVRRLGELHERAVYAGEATADEAAEATRLVRELAAEQPVRERLRP